MRILGIIILLSYISLFFPSIGRCQCNQQETEDFKVDIYNFHRLNDTVFRSGRPTRNQQGTPLKTVKAIKNLMNMSKDSLSVLNLELSYDDHKWASVYKELSKLNLYWIPLNYLPDGPHGIRDGNDAVRDSIVSALNIIATAPKPILVHCYDGSDRTGLIIALYHIIFGGCKMPEAIADMELKKHQKNKPFANIVGFLNNQKNIDYIRKQLKDKYRLKFDIN